MKKIIPLCLCIIVIFSMVSCGNNNKYENMYIDIDEPERSAEGLYWPEGQALPNFALAAETVDAINIVNKNNNVRATLVSLQGIVNRKQPRIHLFSRNTESKEKWLKDCGINYEVEEDASVIFQKYKDEVKGIVIYETKVKDTYNLATTYAGLNDAIVCTAKQAEEFTKEPYNFKILEDYSGRFKDKYEVYNYLYDNLWPECTKRLVVGISTEHSVMNIRDLSIAAKAAVLWLDPLIKDDIELLDKFFKDCIPGETTYAGWWTDEGHGVGIGSDYGIVTVPADYYENYSVYSGTSRELDIPEIPAKPGLENKFYVAFTFSDGDNLQYVQHAMKDRTSLWGSRKRGQVPINWTCAPVLLDAGPQMLNHYYKTATEMDCLVTGPSGIGYTDPQRWNKEYSTNDAFTKFAQRTDTYLRRTGFNVITIWNKIRDDQASIFAKNIPSMVGFTIQERFDGQKDQIIDGSVPLITTFPRYDGDVPRVESIITEQINIWKKDPTSPKFMMPQLVAWDCGVDDIIKIANNLEKRFGEDVVFVRADHMMMLYSEAHGTPYNVALQSDSVTASGYDGDFVPKNAVDGSTAKSKGWQCSDAGEKWLQIDLKDNYKLKRYTVMNAAAGYYSKDANTVSFKIQVSSDGDKWKDVDTVKDNKSNIVDKYFNEVEARYVRLLITEAGVDDKAIIQEFEIYGNKVS